MLRATACVALVALSAGVAGAGKTLPSHAVGGIAVTGNADAGLGLAVRSAAEAGLAGSTLHVSAPAVAKILGAVPDLAGCTDAACLTRFAAAAGADRVVAVEVAAKGELHQLTVLVADTTGRALRRRQDDCIACAVPEIQEKITELVRAAVTAGADDTIAVEVGSTPAGAALTVDGTDRGPTPWRGELTAGAHDVMVTDPDGRAIREQIFVDAAGDGRFSVIIPEVTSVPRRWGTLRWVAAGTGGAALITGIVLLGKDGDGTCDEPVCPERYESTATGVLFVGTGLALGAAAGWMIWQDREHGHPTLAITPTAGGISAAVGGRF